MIDKNLTFKFNHKDQRDKLYEVMTSTEIKEAFDSRAEQLKEYIYSIIDELKGANGSENIGYKTSTVYLKIQSLEASNSNMSVELTNAREGKTTLLLNLTDIRNLISQKAAADHNHDLIYSKLSHGHSEYSLSGHNHNDSYSPLTHNHDTVYSKASHTHKKADVTDFSHTHTKAEITDLVIPPTYSLPTASPTVLGGIKVGANLSIDANGVLSGNAGSSYTLPKASSTVLGGVKVGNTLKIDSNGVLDTASSGSSDYVLPTASASVLGGIKVGSNLTINNGVLSGSPDYTLPTASASVLGGVKIGSGLSIASGVVSVPSSGHTHTKSQITDFAHTHKKSDITDFTHTHNFKDISDMPIYAIVVSLNDSSLPAETRTANKNTIKAYINDTRPNKLLLGYMDESNVEFVNKTFMVCESAYYSEEESTIELYFSKNIINDYSIVISTYAFSFDLRTNDYKMRYSTYNHDNNKYFQSWSGTQAQYDALSVKNSNTTYYIVE